MASIAYFITGHGFGHAARASAVISAIYEKDKTIRFIIFTSIPQWFFDSQDLPSLEYHNLKTDIGMVQDSALIEDPRATLEHLKAYYPIIPSRFQWVEECLAKNNVSLIISDISPLGIFLSNRLQIPGLLIENFTWDWIYGGYQPEYPDFQPFISYLADVYRGADWHIQATPHCQDYSKSDLITNPICRKNFLTRSEIRTQLKVEIDAQMVLVTMGGIETNLDLNMELKKIDSVKFVIPGASSHFKIEDNLILIPHHSRFYYPDLVASSDLVIGKLGYSTLAEIYYAGIPLMYFSRPGFRESQCLINFVRAEISFAKITQEQLHSGEWKSSLLHLIGNEKTVRAEINGRHQVADFILKKIRQRNA
jgi:uncharacterized protein (TIGR00661 family)